MEAGTQENVAPRLKERYESEIKPRLQERFGYASTMQVRSSPPRVSSPRSPASARASAARASRSPPSSCATACRSASA